MKCRRTACSNPNAECWHTHSGDLYCIRCARRINEYNPGLVVMWCPDTRAGRSGEGFISSDGKFVLSPIRGRSSDMPKWIMRDIDCVHDYGDYHFRWAASEFIRNRRLGVVIPWLL